MTEPRKSLLPEDAVFPDDASKKMADEAAWAAADRGAQEKAAEPKAEEAKPEPKSEPETPEKKEDEGKADEAKGDEAKDEDKGDPKPVPAWQFQVFKKQMGKQLEEIKALIVESAKPGATVADKEEVADKVEEVDDALKKFAEKFGWDADMIKELRSVIGVPNAVPPELVEAAESLKAQKAEQEQVTGFTNELAETIAEMPDYQNVDKAKLQELAFSDKYRNYKLADIISLNPDLIVAKSTDGKPSMEHSKGGSRHDTAIDLTKELPIESVAKLTPKQFETYSNNMARSHRGDVTRDGRTVRDS